MVQLPPVSIATDRSKKGFDVKSTFRDEYSFSLRKYIFPGLRAPSNLDQESLRDAANLSLFNQQDFSILQSISPTCRISWHNSFRHLFISKILQQLDDYDSVQLRKQLFVVNKNILLNYFMIFIPLALTFFGVTAAQVIFDTLCPIVSSGIILGNYYLSTLSDNYVIILWLGGALCLGWYFFVIQKGYKLIVQRKTDKSSSASPNLQRKKASKSKHVSSDKLSINISQSIIRKRSFLQVMKILIRDKFQKGFLIFFGKFDFISWRKILFEFIILSGKDSFSRNSI